MAATLQTAARNFYKEIRKHFSHSRDAARNCQKGKASAHILHKIDLHGRVHQSWEINKTGRHWNSSNVRNRSPDPKRQPAFSCFGQMPGFLMEPSSYLCPDLSDDFKHSSPPWPRHVKWLQRGFYRSKADTVTYWAGLIKQMSKWLKAALLAVLPDSLGCSKF